MQIQEIKNVCIINCFDTYEHRVDLIYAFFKEKGVNVQVISSNYKHIEKCKRVDKKQNYEFLKVRPYKKNLSYARLRSHMLFSKSVFNRIEGEHYDVLWILVPPNSLVRDAARYKKEHKDVKVIFDLIDLWPETMPISQFKSLPPFTYWKLLRDRYLNVADSVVTECNLYRKKLFKTIADGTKVHTLYLARQIKHDNIELNIPNDKISLCYLGSINNIIDIKVISDVISRLTKFKPVVIHIVGEGEKREQLIEACKSAGGQVVFHGKIYDESEKQKVFSQCHYGLNIMKESVVVGLTMKSIDYFEGGLPIINNIRGDTWEMVTVERIGFNIDGTEDYNDIINYNLEMRNRVRKLYEKNFSINTFRGTMQSILNEI